MKLHMILATIMYTSVIKAGLAAGMFILWCLCVQWIDRDAVRVKTVREKWNILAMATGILGLFAWLMIPWPDWATYFLGWALYVFISGGGVLMYVAHRNKRVSQQRRVLTAQHFSRLTSFGQSEDKLDRSKHETLVRLFDKDKKPVSLDNDFEAAEQFSATQEVFYDALWHRASEIDLSVTGEATKLSYVIDGVSAERRDFVTLEQAAQVIIFVKKMASFDVEDRRRPQHGTVWACLLGGSGEPAQLEVHTSGTTAGERLRIKVVEHDAVRSLSELGVHPQRLEMLKKLIATEKGMIICSGPPRSGVTTTLYTIIQSHDAYVQNVHTLEKRRLREIDNITQHNYDSTNREKSYARQLQTVLRREPDVVMVGEMDDKETARLSAKSSLEGKKIYAGITATDSFEALDTLLAWIKDRKAAANALLAITNQRLMRKLCPTCREAYRPDPSLLRKANLPVDSIDHFYRPPTQQIFDKQGREIVCPTCQGTGYGGRIGVFELLVIDDVLREMIKKGANTTQIKAQARKKKMYYFQEEGLLKTMEGTTSMNEILRCLRTDKANR